MTQEQSDSEVEHSIITISHSGFPDSLHNSKLKVMEICDFDLKKKKKEANEN